MTNYLSYRRSPDRWALGRFVLSAARLAELEGLLGSLDGAANSADSRVPLTVVLGRETAADVQAVVRFRQSVPENLAGVEAVELKAANGGAARVLLAEMPSTWIRYLEVPPGPDAADVLDAVGEARAFAKLRTGGTTPDAIPAPDEIVAFLESVAERSLAFKATAGLHHPIRGNYPLTYEPAAARAEFYGYLNLLLAAALAWQRLAREQIRAALLEEDPGSIRFDGASLSWRDHRFDVPTLRELRRSFFHGFGSCSFREPLDELAAGPWD